MFLLDLLLVSTDRVVFLLKSVDLLDVAAAVLLLKHLHKELLAVLVGLGSRLVIRGVRHLVVTF